MSQLQLLVDGVNQYAILLLDTAGRITAWNRGAEKIYGYTQDDVVKLRFLNLYSTEDVSQAEEDLATARSEGNSTAVRWQIRKGGSRFWAQVSLTALIDPSGTLCGFGEITEDCTESRHISEMYRSVMSSLRSHIAVVDRSGAILIVNDAWNRFAIENGALLSRVTAGVNYLDLCRRAKAEGAEGAAEALEGLEAVLNRSVEEFTLEYPCHSQSVERWFLLSITPWGLDGGGAVIAHTDITERVRAEQKLRGSEEHYRALIDNEVDVVTILKPDGTICFESPALERILGYKPEELVGRNAFDFINPADLPSVLKEIGNILKMNEPSRPVEFAFRHKDGGWRILESVARNLLANPAVKGIIVNSRDVTARREAEAELRNKEAALKSSHEELRALTGRLLEAEERERRRLSRELHDDLNQKLAALAVDLGGLVRSVRLAEYEKLETDARAIQAQIVKVSDEVRTLAYQLHPSVLDHLGLAVALRSYCEEYSRRENIAVKFFHRNVNSHVSPEVGSCLYRIAQEALRNVAKHSGAKQASVSLVGSKNRVALTIRDFGSGFRPESVRSRLSLGLTSMAERARQIGGELDINSVPEEGTTVVAQVPWRQAPLP